MSSSVERGIRDFTTIYVKGCIDTMTDYEITYRLRYHLGHRGGAGKTTATEVVTAENAEEAIDDLEKEYGENLLEIKNVRSPPGGGDG